LALDAADQLVELRVLRARLGRRGPEAPPGMGEDLPRLRRQLAGRDLRLDGRRHRVQPQRARPGGLAPVQCFQLYPDDLGIRA